MLRRVLKVPKQSFFLLGPRGPAMRTEDDIDIVPFKHLADELAADALWR
jgi:hypothetical protein